MKHYNKSYMTSDESTSVPANQDNGFVGEVTVHLVIKFITHNQYDCRHIMYKIKLKTIQNLCSTWFYFFFPFAFTDMITEGLKEAANKK